MGFVYVYMRMFAVNFPSLISLLPRETLTCRPVLLHCDYIIIIILLCHFFNLLPIATWGRDVTCLVLLISTRMCPGTLHVHVFDNSHSLVA